MHSRSAQLVFPGSGVFGRDILQAAQEIVRNNTNAAWHPSWYTEPVMQVARPGIIEGGHGQLSCQPEACIRVRPSQDEGVWIDVHKYYTGIFIEVHDWYDRKSRTCPCKADASRVFQTFVRSMSARLGNVRPVYR